MFIRTEGVVAGHVARNEPLLISPDQQKEAHVNDDETVRGTEPGACVERNN